MMLKFPSLKVIATNEQGIVRRDMEITIDRYKTNEKIIF